MTEQDEKTRKTGKKNPHFIEKYVFTHVPEHLTTFLTTFDRKTGAAGAQDRAGYSSENSSPNRSEYILLPFLAS